MKKEFDPERTRDGTIIKNVFYLLEEFYALRDSDKKLLLAYYNKYLGFEKQVNQSENPFRTFCSLLYDSDAPTPSSIIRCRAKIQESGYCRGKKYIERLNRAEGVSDWAINTDDYDDIPLKN